MSEIIEQDKSENLAEKWYNLQLKPVEERLNTSLTVGLSSDEVITPEKHDNIGYVTVLRDITLEKELENMKDEFLHSIRYATTRRSRVMPVVFHTSTRLPNVDDPANESRRQCFEPQARAMRP